VEDLLKERKHTVFAGHIHRYVYQKRNNSDYITLATTGGGSALGGPIFGQFDHVLWVTMTDDGPVMANLLLEGIFDEDFSKEDIEKHLELTMRHKVMRVDTEFDDSKPLENQVLKFTLFNHHDTPVESKVEFTNSENISFGDSLKSLSIPPNSAASFEVEMEVQPVLEKDIAGKEEDPIWQKRWDEFGSHHARWTLTYDFEKYGQIEVNGNTRLYR
jgi:hypothetical protein